MKQFLHDMNIKKPITGQVFMQLEVLITLLTVLICLTTQIIMHTPCCVTTMENKLTGTNNIMASCDTADQLSKWLVLLLHEAADNL
jgi:hypothetical protein